MLWVRTVESKGIQKRVQSVAIGAFCGGAVFFLNLKPELFAKHLKLARRLDPDAHRVPADLRDHDPNLVANADGVTFSSAKCEHRLGGVSSSVLGQLTWFTRVGLHRLAHEVQETHPLNSGGGSEARLISRLA